SLSSCKESNEEILSSNFLFKISLTFDSGFTEAEKAEFIAKMGEASKSYSKTCSVNEAMAEVNYYVQKFKPVLEEMTFEENKKITLSISCYRDNKETNIPFYSKKLVADKFGVYERAI
ncbi:MAG: hypothetical protein HUK07_05760, partial [Bacteroidaceae bacterium]|nr:hypothetical protein [Bacteroidaceae bacterium]